MAVLLPVLLAVAAAFFPWRPATSQPPPSVAFVTYDAGETLGLLPVAPLLREAGVEVRWIPLTPWSADLLAGYAEPFLPLPDNIAALPHVEARNNPTEVDYWTAALLGGAGGMAADPARAPPLLAVLGMVSTAQAQMAQALRAAGVPTRGFHDGFQPPDSQAIAAIVAPACDGIWVPTAGVQAGFEALGMVSEVVGQPSLEAWRRASEEVDTQAVRRRVGADSHHRILLFAGQYGDGYEEALDSFLNTVAISMARDSTLLLLLTHHPRTDGSVERAALARWGARPSDLPRMEAGEAALARWGARPSDLPRMAPEGLSTMELATAAEVVLTWTSTVGTQAAFMGKEVIYFSPPPGFESELVRQGVAARATPAALPDLLARRLAHPRRPEDIRRALAEVGYVLYADRVVAERILELVKTPAREARYQNAFPTGPSQHPPREEDLQS